MKTQDETNAGEERAFLIAQGVEMVLCWIPSGAVQLGSPKAERDLLTERLLEGKRLEILDAEAEEKRGKFQTSGFWLGKYEVSQKEWRAVMGSNPSYFQPGGKGNAELSKDRITDTERFPVDQVSWLDCQKFLEKVNMLDGGERVFRTTGKFVLPHEDEWEYASRGGKGNNQPFYWGNELDGSQANCNGTEPYGTNIKGKSLARTCTVDDTSSGKYEKHPWGLHHMLGNAMEWCDNQFDQSRDLRVLRGGSFDTAASDCRSACRARAEKPEHHAIDTGFRVCYRPE